MRNIFMSRFAVLVLCITAVLACGVQGTKAQRTLPMKLLIFFDYQQTEMTKSAGPIIDAAVDVFKATGASSVRVVGHTDAAPSAEDSKRLSQQRADAVKSALAAKGIPISAITAVAAGKSDPMVKTPDGKREPQNRRVEIIISK